jgi:hypothetical protein
LVETPDFSGDKLGAKVSGAFPITRSAPAKAAAPALSPNGKTLIDIMTVMMSEKRILTPN